MLSAAQAFQLDIVLDLMDAGANIALVDKESGDGVLHCLARLREPDEPTQFATLKKIVTGALFKGLSPDVQNLLGMSALHCAARSGSHGVAAMLLQHGADPNLRAIGGETPLHQCLTARPDNCCALAALLLGSGADANALDDGGMSPLHLLQSQPVPHSKEVKELLARMMAKSRDLEGSGTNLTGGIDIAGG